MVPRVERVLDSIKDPDKGQSFRRKGGNRPKGGRGSAMEKGRDLGAASPSFSHLLQKPADHADHSVKESWSRDP